MTILCINSQSIGNFADWLIARHQQQSCNLDLIVVSAGHYSLQKTRMTVTVHIQGQIWSMVLFFSWFSFVMSYSGVREGALSEPYWVYLWRSNTSMLLTPTRGYRWPDCQRLLTLLRLSIQDHSRAGTKSVSDNALPDIHIVPQRFDFCNRILSSTQWGFARFDWPKSRLFFATCTV